MDSSYTFPDFDIDDDLEEADEVFGITPPQIVAYVEAPIDIGFWKKRFDTQDFPVIEFREISQHEPANGKGAIISAVTNQRIPLSKRRIICLDSDYDNLLDNNQDLYNSDFVFQTYAYAIENFFYHPENLGSFVQACAGIYDIATQELPKNKVIEWSNKHFSRFCFLIDNGLNKEQIAQISDNVSLDIVNECMYKPTISDNRLEYFRAKGLTQDNLHIFYRGHNLEPKIYSNIVCEYLTHLRTIKKNDILLDSSIMNKGAAIQQVFSKDLDLKNKLLDRDLNHIREINLIHVDISKFKNIYWT
ncbi:DUF4435 domain-containing protein [Vibrio parahaemolyticus]|uniref:DUF4435 domain-containing protein n=1 Tax=Vibrio parahaemolyticus TaxID=670 RepID=UPI001EE9C213|nr:DUF4435 domain-containing protein [Vibrio parahaemolyticus]MCG6459098.1 DUF4435 domain-containing protein [Vibrio parahaemolyticus]